MSTLNWVKQVIGQDTPNDWLTKVSSDGTKFLAAQWQGGYVYLSAGNNVWEKANIAGGVSLDVDSCAISGNGQYMLVGAYYGKVYLSSNGGTSWSEIAQSELPGSSGIWHGAAISYTGQYMLISEWWYDKLYFSNNYGVSWTLINDGDGYCNAACINDSGSVLVAVGGGGTCISTNSGGSWTTDTDEPYAGLTGASCTALGDIIYLINWEQVILRSSNYGATWTEITDLTFGVSNGNYTACSDDDSVLLYADVTTGLGLSTDKGLHWTFELPTMFDVSSDGSGAVIICGQENGYVYISYIDAAVDFFSNHVVLHVATAGYVKVLGYHWFDNVRIHRYTDTTQGVTPNAISIDSATLVSADIAPDALAKTVEYYGLRYQQNVTLFPDAAIKPSDIQTLSSLYGKRVDGITEKLESDLTGGYLIAAKVVGQERMAS